MGVRTGELDRRITIEQPTTVGYDAAGGPTVEWASFTTLWAKREPMSGSEQFGADQRYARQAAVFTVRHIPGITPAMRVVCEGQIYQIDDVAELDRRQFIRLTCYAFEVPSRT
ncbi:MAG: phage head closure protein [Phycisphaerales bacterium]|nr:phage head closure protein [Phycisphaerales bacterium]